AHAIMVYLARVHASAKLLPADPDAEARCIEWLNWLSSSVHTMSFAQIWRPQRFTTDEDGFPAVRARGKENVRGQFDYIEALLDDGRRWGSWGGYSVVDRYVLVFYYWGYRIDLNMRALYPAWTRLTEQVVARPAVHRVLRDEGVEIFPRAKGS